MTKKHDHKETETKASAPATPPPAPSAPVGSTDPIENAKGGDEGGGEPKPSVQPQEPVIAEPVVTKAAPRFTVCNTQRITISWKGQEVRLDPGSEISEDSYGDGSVEQFRNAGVKLEEVK